MFRTYRDAVRMPKKAEETYPELIPKAYDCNMCDKGGWLTSNDVEIHKKHAHVKIIHEYKNKYTERFCTVCMTLLDSYEEHIKHLKSQHLLSSPNAQRVERIIYICDECTNIFFNKDVLVAHMLSVHLTKKSNRMNKNFTCPKCFKIFRLHTIWFHLQKHEIPSVSLCDICLSNFPDRTILAEHIKSHKRYLKCETCGYSSNKFLQYESHIDQHDRKHVPFNREVSQNVLNSVFKKRKNTINRYNMHNAIKGLNLPKFMQICTLCREICVTHEEKKRHVLRDHMIDATEKKKHLCECGKEFEYKVVLKQHLLKMKGIHRAVDIITKTPSVANEINDNQMDTSNPILEERAEGLDAKAEIIKLIKTKESTKMDMDTMKLEISDQIEAEKANDITFATLSPVHHVKTENNKIQNTSSERVSE